MQNQMTAEKKKEGGFGHLVKIVVVLTAICVAIALLLAFINKITVGPIAENAKKQQSDAISALFADIEGEKKVEVYDLDGTTVYAVMLSQFEVDESKIIDVNGIPGIPSYAVQPGDSVLLGYAVESVGNGFGGEIRTMVGFDVDGSVRGVRIISMSETPGVGTKTQSDDFLSRFIGKSKEMTVGVDVDGITGATRSSKGVTEAVNNAIKATEPLDVPAMADEIGAVLNVSNVKTGGNN